MPSDWLRLTTHRLDIYNEEQAKIEFLEKLEALCHLDSMTKEDLEQLPTAYDYIRLGHPLSCLLEWFVAKSKNLSVKNVICFSSQTMPLFAILRSNLLSNKKTRITYEGKIPSFLDVTTLRDIYGYHFELVKREEAISTFDGITVALTEFNQLESAASNNDVDFMIHIHQDLGSVVIVNTPETEKYISEIQHVRRRESIAMTPDDSLTVLKKMIGESHENEKSSLVNTAKNRALVLETIKNITNTSVDACIGSSGLSIQYAIMMGLIHHSLKNNKDKKIKIIVPPNCYGGTNDQARRVAASIDNVEVLDLPVDGGQDMVESVEKILTEVAVIDAVPFIIAEIPTNPRVEVPVLDKLRVALSKIRKTKEGNYSISPVFILDQTFCPNTKFLGENDILSSVQTISYVSGSKFPSGGLCTAGYCVANNKAQDLLESISKHLQLCQNEATPFQIEILARQMPSMIERIASAYKNTRNFVNHIQEVLPQAKINFVSNELAVDGFTPSVFSLDLPTRGDTPEARESYKRNLNLKLINLMIKEIPDESKHCVSYGQLKGCYWTIPATSTQGTTREGDKDYIVRVSISPDFDLDLHKKVFSDFCREYISIPE